MKKNKNIVLLFLNVDIKSLTLRVYSDALYAMNDDRTSQLEYVIFIADKNDNCHSPHWIL